jgi:hypothetical protein
MEDYVPASKSCHSILQESIIYFVEMKQQSTMTNKYTGDGSGGGGVVVVVVVGVVVVWWWEW